MNQRKTLGYLLAVERADILADVADLLDDPQISVVVTYRDYQNLTRVPSTGAMTPTFTDFAVRAVRSEISASEVRAGAGLYEIGDVSFFFAQSDLPGITPFRQDEIVLGANTFGVRSWRGDALSAFWRVIARRVK